MVDLTRHKDKDASWWCEHACCTWCLAAPVRPTGPGSSSVARRSAPASRSLPSTLSMGYKNAVDAQLEDARSVLDAFHVVKLATQVVDDVRRRVQQDTTGHQSTAWAPGRPAVSDPEHTARARGRST